MLTAEGDTIIFSPLFNLCCTRHHFVEKLLTTVQCFNENSLFPNHKTTIDLPVMLLCVTAPQVFTTWPSQQDFQLRCQVLPHSPGFFISSETAKG